MKKFFVLFLALTFVLSMAAFAVADDGGADSVRSHMAGTHVIIGGDARVEGVWHNNYQPPGTGDTDGNFDKNDDYDSRYWRQRLRLIVNATVGNGIEMRSRISTDNDIWHGTYNTAGTDSAHSRDISGVLEVDYMYLHIPINNFVVDTGLMRRSWGNKWHLWDSQRDTFQVTTNVGDTQIGVFTDKVEDTSDDDNRVGINDSDPSENLEDQDNYGIFVNHTSGDFAAGLLVILEDDNADQDSSGTEFSAYFNTSVGAIGIAAEVAMTTGDIEDNGMNEDSFDNNRIGGFIAATTDVGAIGLTVAGMVAKDGYSADSHFTPSVFFGTDNPTAIADIASAAGSTTWAVYANAVMPINSALSLSGTLLYADLENLGMELGGVSDTGQETASEIDLGLKYKLADNAVYSVDLGYLMPNDINLADDAAMALRHRIEVAF